MVKYVDTGLGEDTSGGKKKKVKKGFKADRRENYVRMITKQRTGKDVKKKESGTAVRAKNIVFDSSSLRDYVLTLHKRKNERRVQAFVDAKRRQRRDHAKTRQQQREEARRAYNNYAKVPILPDYTYRLPHLGEDDINEVEDDDDAENDAHGDSGEEHDDAEEENRSASDQDEEGDLPWVMVDGEEKEGVGHAAGDSPSSSGDELSEGYRAKKLKGSRKATREAQEARRRRKARLEAKRLAREELTTHVMPVAMSSSSSSAIPSSSTTAATTASTATGTKKGAGKASTAAGGGGAASAARSSAPVDADVVTVEVKPLFPVRSTSSTEHEGTDSARGSANAKKNGRRGLPSSDFSDLPEVVEQALRNLRQELKGPSRTKSKVHVMKELEKIRKIRKHSRKGHGKRTASGKRKNRRK